MTAATGSPTPCGIYDVHVRSAQADRRLPRRTTWTSQAHLAWSLPLQVLRDLRNRATTGPPLEPGSRHGSSGLVCARPDAVIDLYAARYETTKPKEASSGGIERSEGRSRASRADSRAQRARARSVKEGRGGLHGRL